jgi:signal transduction histidine kinase
LKSQQFLQSLCTDAFNKEGNTVKKIVIVVLIVIISLLHYLSPVDLHQFHAIYQRLYYIPVILAAYWFGLRGGLITAVITGIAYIPHIFFQWAFHPTEAFTQYIEIVMFFIIGSLVGILSNIQKLQTRQIEEAQIQIRQMDRLRLLGQLAAGLAHEIRNPLGSLIGSTEILRDSLGKEHPKIEFVDIMYKELNRLRDKLNEFLIFAKPAPPQKIENNLNDIINEAVSLIHKQASKSSVNITTDLDSGIPLIPMDAEQLKQVILNLLLNAIQAMPDGGAVSITTWQEKKSLGFSVQDEGPGIPEENRTEIFNPFFTTKSEGTGLGLAIVNQLIISMNCTIKEIPVQKGARFEVRIPYE